MQRLHERMAASELNAYLDAGSLVVWLHRYDNGLYDTVLDHPEAEPGVDAVLAFLQSVNPTALNEAMTKGIRLTQSPAESALRALINLAGGDDERP